MEQVAQTSALGTSTNESTCLSALDFFRANYPLRAPRSGTVRNSDEIRQITPEEGLNEFNLALGSMAQISQLPFSAPRGNTYLWVIGKNSIPAALETEKVGQSLQTGIIKHTNLTGGDDAHCGGEVWFIEKTTIVLGGSSGRYGPDTFDEKKIIDAGQVFKEQGYQVAVLGIDETGFPATLLVGDPQWL
jgi:hypothetical protein